MQQTDNKDVCDEDCSSFECTSTSALITLKEYAEIISRVKKLGE